MDFFKMGKVALRSLFAKPATRNYPVEQREFSPNTRGHIEMDVEHCVACGICAKRCPASAITVDRNERTWSIERMYCIQCGACVEACPKKSLSMKPMYANPDFMKVVDTYQLPDLRQYAPADENVGQASSGLTCDSSVCVFCGLCAKNCPTDALTVDRANKSWSVNKDACVECGTCVEKCPKKCLSL